MKIARLAVVAAVLMTMSTQFASAKKDITANAKKDITQYKLANGLTVILKESHAAPVFSAQVWFGVGSRNEVPGITGTSHLLEHMLFNTSENYKKGEISNMVRYRGGIENAATGNDYTYYWQLLSSMNDNLEFSIMTLAERVGRGLILPDELENEKTVVISEMKGRDNSSSSLLYDALFGEAYKVHTYGTRIVGSEEDVRGVTRERVLEYYHSNYGPANAALVIVGDFDTKEAKALIDKYFGVLPAAEVKRYEPKPEPKQTETRYTYVNSGALRRVYMGYKTPPARHPDYAVLNVIDQILSGGRSSRLYSALVDKGYAAEAFAFAYGHVDDNIFIVAAIGAGNTGVKTIEKALRLECDRLKREKVTEEELTAAKNRIKADFTFGCDSVSDQGNALGNSAVTGGINRLFEYLPAVEKVTAEDVMRAAKEYFVPEGLTVAIIDPERNEGGSLSAPDKSAGLLPEDPRKHKTNTPFRAVLDNGITVIVSENHSNPTIALEGSMLAGNVFNAGGKYGVPALTADMVSRGTKTRNMYEQAAALDNIGAYLDFEGRKETTHFSGKALSEDTEVLFEQLADRLMNATFPEEMLKLSKTEAEQSLKGASENPSSVASVAFDRAVYAEGSPYRPLEISESLAQLETVTVDDLKAFYNKYYRPDTMIIAIVGDITPDKAVRLAKKYLGSMKAEGPKPVLPEHKYVPTLPKRIDAQMKGKTENIMLYGNTIDLKRTDPDYHVFRIANHILGGAGAMGSIMGNEIREENGLAYSVYSTFDTLAGESKWYARVGTDKGYVERVAEMLEEETRRVIAKGFDKAMFDKAKNYLMGVFPIALETNEGVANTLLNAEFNGFGTDYIETYLDNYKDITLEQVNAAAKKYLKPDTSVLVVVGEHPEKK
ncbi:MAG: insulinase family protein [Abditibacteriota bacterium]|nr:insulinase family protein [Abditibacteriota bacterium]